MDFENEISLLGEETILNLTCSKELIDLVRINECLWKKQSQNFKDTKINSLCWATIGKAVSYELSGAEAEKEFYKLRQKFGREMRKVRDSAPRSGAGAAHQSYQSRWELYTDLLFLNDAIRPRRSVSNFVPLRPSPSPSPPVFVNDNRPLCHTPLADVESSQFSGSDVDGGVSITESPGPSNRKGSVPPPDYFYKKKKREEAETNKALSEHYNNLNAITQTISNSFASCTSAPNEVPIFAPDPLFLCGGSAVQRVPQRDQLTCIIEMLQVAKKYENKD